MFRTNTLAYGEKCGRCNAQARVGCQTWFQCLLFLFQEKLAQLEEEPEAEPESEREPAKYEEVIARRAERQLRRAQEQGPPEQAEETPDTGRKKKRGQRDQTDQSKRPIGGRVDRNRMDTNFTIAKVNQCLPVISRLLESTGTQNVPLTSCKLQVSTMMMAFTNVAQLLIPPCSWF